MKIKKIMVKGRKINDSFQGNLSWIRYSNPTLASHYLEMMENDF